MIIVNGTIQALTSAKSTINDDGDPVTVPDAWGDPINCNIRTTKHDKKGIYEDGEFIQASYEILLDMQTFEADKIRVINNRSKVLGEFEIQDIQFLDKVQRVKIVV